MERILALGASQLADHRRPDGSGWITLADPEGNEFCILTRDPAGMPALPPDGRGRFAGPPLSAEPGGARELSQFGREASGGYRTPAAGRDA